jgi:hypothetical protein
MQNKSFEEKREGRVRGSSQRGKERQHASKTSGRIAYFPAIHRRHRWIWLPFWRRGASSGVPDGSGKSIKMDAPLVKAIRAASVAIKYTYVWFGVIVFCLFGVDGV